MSWQLFVVIQTAAFALAAVAALGLRNHALRRQNNELTVLCQAAHDELVNLTDKLKNMETTAPPEKMLEQRIKGMSGEDPTTLVRRLVLENEIKPRSDFADRLAEHLAQEEPEEQEFVQRWRSIRAECQQLAMFLIADNPAAYTAITQLFEVIEPLDLLYDVELEPLVAPEDKPAGDGEAVEDPAAGSADASADVSAGDGDEELDQAALDELLTSAQSTAAAPDDAGSEVNDNADDAGDEAGPPEADAPSPPQAASS